MAGEMVYLSSLLGISIFFLVVIIIWSAVWKGIALWKAGTRKQLIWFIVLFLVNTLGILEILYIFVFSKTGKKQGKIKKKK